MKFSSRYQTSNIDKTSYKHRFRAMWGKLEPNWVWCTCIHCIHCIHCSTYNSFYSRIHVIASWCVWLATNKIFYLRNLGSALFSRPFFCLENQNRISFLFLVILLLLQSRANFLLFKYDTIEKTLLLFYVLHDLFLSESWNICMSGKTMPSLQFLETTGCLFLKLFRHEDCFPPWQRKYVFFCNQ